MTNKFKWTSTTIPEIKSAAEELVKSAIKDVGLGTFYVMEITCVKTLMTLTKLWVVYTQ